MIGNGCSTGSFGLDEARSRDDGGCGLGLAIVDEVIRAHSGTVSISRSSLGGARIEVTLPTDDT